MKEDDNCVLLQRQLEIILKYSLFIKQTHGALDDGLCNGSVCLQD